MADTKNESVKHYFFKCGIEAYQEECCYSQDKQILKLLETVDIGDVQNFSEMKVSDIITKIFNTDLIPKLFDIILMPEDLAADNPPDWNLLKRSEVVEVIEDFFSLSPVLKKLFGTGRLNPDSLSDSAPKTVN